MAIQRDEQGNRFRDKNRRYVDRKYIKKKQKLNYKDWIKLIKFNAAQGKQFQADDSAPRMPTPAIED